jgi:quercetin dioxygenase-like cupin family protein
LRAGDLLHLPPGVPHALRATEAMTMLLVLGGTGSRSVT